MLGHGIVHSPRTSLRPHWRRLHPWRFAHIRRLHRIVRRIELSVDLVHLLVEVLEAELLGRRVHVLLHLPLHVFHEGLGLADVATSSNSRSFLDCIVREHIVIGLLFQLVTLSTHLLLFGDDAETLGAIKCRVDDLSLEREARNLGHVDFFHG